MADYIELETAIDFVKNNTPTIDGMTTLGCVERSLYNAPNANVVEVVRCKHCVSFGVYECTGNGYCRHYKGLVDPKPYNFCSYGERKDNG